MWLAKYLWTAELRKIASVRVGLVGTRGPRPAPTDGRHSCAADTPFVGSASPTPPARRCTRTRPRRACRCGRGHPGSRGRARVGDSRRRCPRSRTRSRPDDRSSRADRSRLARPRRRHDAQRGPRRTVPAMACGSFPLAPPAARTRWDLPRRRVNWPCGRATRTSSPRCAVWRACCVRTVGFWALGLAGRVGRDATTLVRGPAHGSVNRS